MLNSVIPVTPVIPSSTSHSRHPPVIPVIHQSFPSSTSHSRHPPVIPAKAGTQRNRHSHTNQGRQQPLASVARHCRTRASISSLPAPPSRRSRAGTVAKLVVPAPPSSLPAPPLVVPSPPSSYPRPFVIPAPPPRRTRASIASPLRHSRASPSSFPRRREPSATAIHTPTKVANNPHPRSPATVVPVPPSRHSPRLPLVVPAPPPRRSRAGRPLQNSSYPRLPLVVPAPPSRHSPRLPFVIPAKAGTQRNRHSHTNQGRQQPPPPVPRSRRTLASPSSLPRLPLVVPRAPPRHSREGGNPAQPPLTHQPRSPTPPPPVPRSCRTRASPSSYPRLHLVTPLASPSSFPRGREPSATAIHAPTKVANNSLPLVFPMEGGICETEQRPRC